jgi:hypothetical protein
MYQGLLVGLFVNGIARWGFASILETPGSLLAGSQEGTLLPAISVLAIGAKNISFNLGQLPIYDVKSDKTFDGISILVNDVERFRGYGDNKDYWPDGYVPGGNFSWTWTRHVPGRDVDDVIEYDDVDETSAALAEYFRFGYMAGTRTGDYTKAGKWKSDGNWVPMEDGPS